jgi:hypothetical protein
MMSIHPEIRLESEKPGTDIKPHQTFYFRSKSGLVAKISTHSKEDAIQMYYSVLLPPFSFPGCLFCSYKYCDARYCKIQHYYRPEMNMEPRKIKEYIDIIHELLIRHPNANILKRIGDMWWYGHTIEYTDWKTILENSDGTVTRHHPQKKIIHWEKANIHLKTLCDSQNEWFFHLKEVIELLTGINIKEDICFEAFVITISSLTKKQIDILSGSLEPTTEPPTSEPEPQGEAMTWSKRATHLRRRFNKNTYEAIELSTVQPSIHP